MTTKQHREIMYGINGPKGGGLSKTGSVLDVASIAILAGLKVGLIDADRSTGALSTALENSDALCEKLTEENDIAAKIMSKYADCDIILQDNGALGISEPKIMGPTAEIIESVGLDNVRLFLNQIPHKSGMIDDLKQIYLIYQWLPNKYIFQVNIDGGGAFDPLKEPLLHAPIIEIPHLTASQINVYSSRKVLPSDLLLDPPPNQQLVCKQLAGRLLQIALSNEFAKRIGAEAAIPVLRRMSEGAPVLVMPKAYVSNDDALSEYISLQRHYRNAMSAETDQLRIQHLKQSQIHEGKYNDLKTLL